MRTRLALVLAATLSVACGAGERRRDPVEIDIAGAQAACNTSICRISTSSGDPLIHVGTVLDGIGIPYFTWRSLGTLYTFCVRSTDRARAIEAPRAEPRTRDVEVIEDRRMRAAEASPIEPTESR